MRGRRWVSLDCVVAFFPKVPLRPGRTVLVYPGERRYYQVRDAERCVVLRVDPKRGRVKVKPS